MDAKKAGSLGVLTLQNTALAILLRLSETQGPKYSAPTAVLVNEILKGTISLCIAYQNFKSEASKRPLLASPSISAASSTDSLISRLEKVPLDNDDIFAGKRSLPNFDPVGPSRRVLAEVFSADCWKLAIPAVLYVIQNNLQFIAASNLDVATFQISYQLKILTTAIFSVLLLKKRLTNIRWAALLFLALGVGIVQVQAAGASHHQQQIEHQMNALLGYSAVLVACMTSGLAGVYFEMVLKGSPANIWTRNVQLSLFSLVPALLPAVRSTFASGRGWMSMFEGFGPWAWAVIWCQIVGGLATALVIKYSDNIVKGFATSLSIILSFVASAWLFPDEFHINLLVITGTATVLAATYLYNSQSESSPTTKGRNGALHVQQRESLLPTSLPSPTPSLPNSPRKLY